MRIGCISDIHGNSTALTAVMSVLLDEVDSILFLGDLCGYYPFVEECVNLMPRNRIIGIRGNHDQVLLDCLESEAQPSSEYRARYGSALGRSLGSLSSSTISVLQSLPHSRLLSLDGVAVALYHGAPWNPLEGRVYPDFDDWDRFSSVPADVILLGQTHHPFAKRHRDKLIVNPGSVGQPRDRSGEACFAILDLASGAVEHSRVPFDPRTLIADAREHDPENPYLADVLVRR